MATSGQIQTNTAFGYVKLEWETSSQNIENNYSILTYTLSIYRSSNISSTVGKSYSITFNGSTVATGSTTINGSGTKTIKTGNLTIYHNADGTKTFDFSFALQIDITWDAAWIGTVTGSGSGTLDAIPRATNPVLSASSVDMGETIAITLSRASSEFTHSVSYVFGNTSGTISANAETSATWIPSIDLAQQIPNANSGTATITCKTYNGSTLIGTKSISIILKVPASVVPVINSVSRTEAVTSPTIAETFGNFVQNQSKINVATSANGAQGATITGCVVTLQDANSAGMPILATYYGANITTDILTWNTTKIRVGVKVTDSRGRVASVFYDHTVLQYTPPIISAFSAYRSDSSGNPNDDSTMLKITLNFSIDTIDNLNGKYYEVVYKIAGASSWAGNIASGNIYSRNESFYTSSVTFDTNSAYELGLYLRDTFENAHSILTVPPAFTLLDCRSTGKGIAFGKASEKDAMEIAMDVYFTGNVYGLPSSGGGGDYTATNYTIPASGVITSGRANVVKKSGWCMVRVGVTISDTATDWITILDSSKVPATQNNVSIFQTIPYWSTTYTRPLRAAILAAGGLRIRYGDKGEFQFIFIYPIE